MNRRTLILSALLAPFARWRRRRRLRRALRDVAMRARAEVFSGIPLECSSTPGPMAD